MKPSSSEKRYDALILKDQRKPRLPPKGTNVLALDEWGGGCEKYLRAAGQKLPDIKYLILSSSSQRDLDFLACFPKLTRLTCTLYAASDLSGLAQCARLEELSLSGLSIRGSLESIAQLSRLASLGVQGPGLQKGFESLPPLKKLRELFFYQPKWDLRLIARFAPQVEDLRIYHNNSTSLEFLLPLKQLRRLSIAYFRKLKSVSLLDRLELDELEISHCPHVPARRWKKTK